MTETALLYALALQNAPKIGDITAKKLINHCGSVTAIFKEKRSSLLKIGGVGELLVRELFDKNLFRQAEAELNFIKKHSIVYHYYLDESYPLRLKHCIDGPILLFQKGSINIVNQPIK